MNYLWETFKIAFYLVLIITFILAIYYLLKNRFNLNNSREMEIIDSMKLANGENLYLIKVFDEIVMLGGTKNELNHLQSWPLAEINLKDSKKAKETKFKETFKNFLAKNNNNIEQSSRDQKSSDQKDNKKLSSDQDE